MTSFEALADRVGRLMREVAAEIIVPRFRSLKTGDVMEKSPGEVVTIVDHEAERRIEPVLLALRPGSRVVGEEAVAADATLLHKLDVGEVWLVDPLDGTANFVAGTPCFAVMVTWLRDGVAYGAWVLDPLRDELIVAERGAGAFANGVRLRADAAPSPLQGIVKTRFLPADLRQRLLANAHRLGEPMPGTGCAGADYPELLRATPRFALYWRTLPWDHAPGVLLLTEAGGHAARIDGTPYLAADPRFGLLAARSRADWDAARELLFP